MVNDEPTRPSLLERLRDPDDSVAWSRFVSLYSPLIYSFARKAGFREPDALDLVQDVFMTLVNILPTFAYDQNKKFRGWLHTVTMNKLHNVRRRQTKQGHGGVDADKVSVPDDLEEIWEAEHQQHLATIALRIMKADFQETTWKACWETVVSGRPAAEVAEELKISVGAVYVAKRRVMIRLKEELKGMLD